MKTSILTQKRSLCLLALLALGAMQTAMAIYYEDWFDKWGNPYLFVYYDEVDGICYNFEEGWNNGEVSVMPICEEFQLGGGYSGHNTYRSYTDGRSLIIPETVTFEGHTYTVTGIAEGALCGCVIDTLFIPKTIRYIAQPTYNGYGITGPTYRPTDIQRIVVDPENPYYCAKENALIDKERKSLVHGPSFTGVIPEGVNSIDDHAFYRGSGTVIIPDCVTSLGEYAFEYYKGSVQLGKGIKTIEEGTFESFHGDIQLWDGIEEIGRHAFRNGDISLSELPKSLKTIGIQAFGNCSSINDRESFKIPNDVTYIGLWAFSQPKWTSLYVGPIPSGVNSDWVHSFNYDNCTLYVPKGSKEAYQNAGGWNKFTHIVEIEVNTTDVSQYQNAIYAEDVKQWPELKVTIPIRLKNTDYAAKNDAMQAIKSFQFDITIPDGTSFVKEDGEYALATTALVPDNWMLQMRTNGNSARIIAASQDVPASCIACGDDVILNLDILLDKYVDYGELPITISGVRITRADGTVDATMFETPMVSKLEVPVYKQGDANGDNFVDVGDISTIIEAIYGTPAGTYLVKSADVTGDGEVNILDILAIIDMIFGDEYQQAPRRGRDRSEAVTTDGGHLSAMGGGSFVLPVTFGGCEYTDFQADLRLPVGFHAVTATMASAFATTHQLVARNVAGGSSYRLLGFSPERVALTGAPEVALVTIAVDADVPAGAYQLSLADAVTSDARQVCTLGTTTFTVQVADPAGIEQLSPDATPAAPAYDLFGRSATTGEGLLMYGGRKILRR